MAEQEGTYLPRLEAQIAYRITKGIPQDEILKWFHTAYPKDTDRNYFEALDAAEQQAKTSLRYRELGALEKLEKALPEGFDPRQTVPIRFNVYVPTASGEPRWLTVILQAKPGMTVALIEESVRAIAEDAVATKAENYDIGGDVYTGPRVLQVGGIVT